MPSNTNSRTANDQGFVFGDSEAVRHLNVVVGQIARTDIGVLLVGESGTGKEAYARLIHQLSVHGQQPLKKVKCGVSEPGELFSQLRACVEALRGSDSAGCGTLFLDGVDELDLAGQKLLLSLLPDGGIPEGSNMRLRVISTASHKLEAEVESGRFRRELYFRINGVRLHLPALRERKEDIPEFMAYFLAKHSSESGRQSPTLSNDELGLLTSYNWPGNIRELGNLARKMVAIGNSKIALADLGIKREAAPHAPKECESFSLKVAARAASRQVERQLILEALERTHWNRKRAAQELQISYKSLLYKIRQTGVDGTKASQP